MQSTQSLRFSRKDSQRFFKTLNQRVNIYFKENKIKKTGNWKVFTLICHSKIKLESFNLDFVVPHRQEASWWL